MTDGSDDPLDPGGPPAASTTMFRVSGRYRKQFTAADYERVKEAVLDYAAQRPEAWFDATEVVFFVIARQATRDTGDVVQMLADLTDLEYLEKVNTDPLLWRSRQHRY